MNKELLDQAIKCLAIQDVRLRESNITMKKEFEPASGEIESFAIQFRHNPLSSHVIEKEEQDNQKVKILGVRFEGAYRLVPPDLSEETNNNPSEMEKLTFVEVQAIFIAYYLITNDEISKEAIEEFCINNVGYHIWPYWREYAQSTALRLGIPPIALPLYTLPK